MMSILFFKQISNTHGNTLTYVVCDVGNTISVVSKGLGKTCKYICHFKRSICTLSMSLTK